MSRHRGWFCATCLLIVAGYWSAPQDGFGDDWPMWRGPSGDGVCYEQRVPETWSPEHNIAFKISIPGVGHSSPIVSGDRVFVTSADLNNKSRMLLAIGRNTGKLLWKKTVVTAEIEEMHPSNSPASGTPASDGQRVFVLFQAVDELLVSAYDFDGNIVWQKVPGGFKSRHGFHTCPVIYEDSILVSGMQDSLDAFVVRLERSTGRTIWKSHVPTRIRSFSTPLVLDQADPAQMVISGGNGTFGFALETGELLWSVDGPAEKTVSSLVASDKFVFVAGGRDNQLFAIGPDGRGDVTETHIAWTANKGIPYINSPVLAAGKLHVISDQGVYSCYQPDTGELLLQKRLLGRSSSSPIAVGDRLYLTSEDGTTTIISADGTGKVIGTNSVGEPVVASLAVADGEIFVRGTSHLFKISAANGN